VIDLTATSQRVRTLTVIDFIKARTAQDGIIAVAGQDGVGTAIR